MGGTAAEFLRSTELFRSLEPAAFEDLLVILRRIEVKDGDLLIRQGDVDRNLYLLVSGNLLVMAGADHRNQELPRISPGQSLREAALLWDDGVSETIISEGQSVVFSLSRAAFDEFSARHPQAALQISEALSARLQKVRLLAALRQSDLFCTLSPAAISDLESELEMFTLYGGEVLFRQGDIGDSLSIVIRGRVRVIVEDKNGRANTVAELGAGELIGEMAVVTGESRSATVEAIRDTHIAKLSRSGFERFMARHPSAAVQTVSRKLAQRLQETTAGKPASKGISTIALIPAHAGAPVSAVSEALAVSLSKFGGTIRLNSRTVDQHLGREGIAQTYERSGSNIRVVEWLNDREMTHDYVLYETDPSLSPWTERCLRQADHILVIGEGQHDSSPGDMESELLQSVDERERSRRWLILVHSQGNPSDTGKWLEARHLEHHFHVRPGRPADFDRVARFLTGRAVALTLGGGFARALAHPGVFQAFAELGIPIDAVGGASMGAMIGALWATGWEPQKIVEEICAGCEKAFDDVTFPFIALKAGKRFSAWGRKLFGDIQIEDLWTPYFCVSANLNRSELKVHTRGSLAKAVLATTRAPGVFPPVVYDGELHVDGGVINNVPVDIMKSFSNQGITIGVDVSPPHELDPVRDYGDEVGGWAAFWERWNPFSKSRTYTPNILLVMIRTLEYSGISNKNLRLKSADLYMHPDLLRFTRTDFHLAQAIAKAGYDCAKEGLLQWLNSSDARERRPDLGENLFEGRKGVAVGVKERCS
jgi:NTE family protein/lysophospholipid hydrolase